MQAGSDTATGEVLEFSVDDKKFGDFFFAARMGDVDTVKALIADGVPVGFADPSGWTALRYAACEGHEEVVDALLEVGAAEDELEKAPPGAEEEGKGGGSSLHWAAYKGHVRLVWRLLTCKPSLNPKALDAECNTPLHLAAASGHTLILQTLLSQGVDVSLKNSYGNTASALSTSADCHALLKEAAKAALDGRPYLCSCSGEFCSEADSAAEEVIDKVSGNVVRPVRYSSQCLGEIRASEDAVSGAMKVGDVEALATAIARAEKIGASLPLIDEAVAALERLRAQIALTEAVGSLEAARPTKDKALLRPLAAPLKMAKERVVPGDPLEGLIADAERLVSTVEAEVGVFDVLAMCVPFKMISEEEIEEPPSADSDFARKAESGLAKLAGAIFHATDVDAMASVLEEAQACLDHLTEESNLRKALLPPKEGVSEDGTPCQTQYNGSKTYSALEDLQFRNDFLDASIDKCVAFETPAGIVAHAQKVQKDLKAALKVAQAEEEERLAKEAAAAAKAAKKKKNK